MKKNEIIVINKDNYILTNKRTHTRRGVIWLGQTCNLKCYFCYFVARIADKTHPEHTFMSLEKAKIICNTLREDYELNSIDIQGGEPTIYPKIFELLDFCNKIGLKPTLITNLVALHNYSFCKKFKEHKVYDFLVSLQAIGDDYDRIVGLKGAFEKQLKALDNFKELNILFRVNIVLTNEALPHLREICNIAVNKGARVVNFIGYNNAGDQKKLRQREQIPYYKYIANTVQHLIEYLEENDIEVNVRFIPFCVFNEKYRKNIQNAKQKIYDLHEWELSSRFWIGMPNQLQAAKKIETLPNLNLMINKLRLKNNHSILDVLKHRFSSKKNYYFSNPTKYQTNINKMLRNYKPYFSDKLSYVEDFSKVDYFYNEILNLINDKVNPKKCLNCDLYPICDGFNSDYTKNFGEEEVEPIKIQGNKVFDPRFYINKQMKVVEKEEFEWFFGENIC